MLRTLAVPLAVISPLRTKSYHPACVAFIAVLKSVLGYKALRAGKGGTRPRPNPLLQHYSARFLTPSGVTNTDKIKPFRVAAQIERKRELGGLGSGVNGLLESGWALASRRVTVQLPVATTSVWAVAVTRIWPRVGLGDTSRVRAAASPAPDIGYFSGFNSASSLVTQVGKRLGKTSTE